MIPLPCFLKKLLVAIMLVISSIGYGSAQITPKTVKLFTVKGFHIDMRIQVMPIEQLKAFALKLSKAGINTLIIEWEGTYPYDKHPLLANRYAYNKADIIAFINYCNFLGLDVIPLQQSFGHVEYILRNDRYKELREDQKDYSQVCPLQVEQAKALFTDLYTDLASVHTSKYIHIGGDETYLLGHDARCKLALTKEGKSKLYIDYIKMLCGIVIKLGKTPVLWADIALKYPDAIKELPKSTVFIDWNYGWDVNKQGNHQKLLQSGYEIWGAPAIRSSPDNYYLTQWEKHFKNIHDFVPAAAKMGYKGIVLTSWSTSGIYSPVFESENELTELYPVRRVYPISGFNMLIAAYAESIKLAKPLDIETFIVKYGKEQYGFNFVESAKFWTALKSAPYDIVHGRVDAAKPITISNLLDSAKLSAQTLNELKPEKNKEEFDHYKLMAAIRVHYLAFHEILQRVNSPAFTNAQIPTVLQEIKILQASEETLDKQFIELNKSYMHPAELKRENDVRNNRIRMLYERLSRKKTS